MKETHLNACIALDERSQTQAKQAASWNTTSTAETQVLKPLILGDTKTQKHKMRDYASSRSLYWPVKVRL